MEIRKFRSGDLEQILRISQNSFTRSWSTNEFEKHLAETFVAESDEEIVAFIVGKTTGETARIKLIAVDKTYRQQKIGQKLIEYLLNHFKKNGAETVSAHARISNKTGISFLKTFGLQIVKTVENYYTDNEAAYLLKKDLDG
jgi:ribosomal-protein-alanine N-acetyltransferase